MQRVLLASAPQAVSIFMWACAALSCCPNISFLAAAAKSLGRVLSASEVWAGCCQVATAYASFMYIPENLFMEDMAWQF